MLSDEVARILSLMGKSVSDMVFAGAKNYLGKELNINPAVSRIKEIVETENGVTILCTGALTNIRPANTEFYF